MDDVDTKADAPRESARDSARGQYLHVEAQKDAIVRAVGAGDRRRAGRLAAELIRAQSETSRSDLLAKSLCDLARRAQAMGELAFAESWLDAALAHAPEDPIVWSQRIGLLRKLRRPNDRLDWTARMVERFPENEVALVTRASALRTAGQLDAALEMYERAIAKAPRNSYARNGRAALLRRLGDFDAAEAAYLETTRLCPDDEFAWNGVGSVRRARGDFLGAIETFRATCARFPEGPLAHHRLAEALLVSGRLAEAVGVCDEATRRFPTDLGSSRARARALLASGRSRDALVEAERLAPQSFGAPGRSIARAEVLKDLDRLEEAARIYRDVQRRGYLDSMARATYGMVLVRLGRGPHAMNVLCVPGWDPMRTPTSSTEWLLFLSRGVVALHGGSTEAAKRSFTVALDSPFIDVRGQARNALILASLLEGDAASAQRLLAAFEPSGAILVTAVQRVLRALVSADERAFIEAACNCPLYFRPFQYLRQSARTTRLSAPFDHQLVDALLEAIVL